MRCDPRAVALAASLLALPAAAAAAEWLPLESLENAVETTGMGGISL